MKSSTGVRRGAHGCVSGICVLGHLATMNNVPSDRLQTSLQNVSERDLRTSPNVPLERLRRFSRLSRDVRMGRRLKSVRPSIQWPCAVVLLANRHARDHKHAQIRGWARVHICVSTVPLQHILATARESRQRSPFATLQETSRADCPRTYTSRRMLATARGSRKRSPFTTL